ncbi:hypothetical protein K0M31_014239 [Melipona bicolor]|uniref:Uncharacterized protein n=1 Tax=Melipona bicolor TaxID=60889 RepID=A0AA40KU39_9HYME|nr:hypothetical protein K0M31_014239 [Melipona bicolor]
MRILTATVEEEEEEEEEEFDWKVEEGSFITEKSNKLLRRECNKRRGSPFRF